MTTCAHKLCTEREHGCECNRYAVNRLHLDGHEHVSGFSLNGTVIQLYKNIETSKLRLTDGTRWATFKTMASVADALNDEIKWEAK